MKGLILCSTFSKFLTYLFFPDDWLMFDDDNVTPISSEDVLKLSGGGKYDVR